MASRARDQMTRSYLTWARCRGRNGVDVPSELPEDMAVEALNVALVRGAIGEKRRGSAARVLTGTFSGFSMLARYLPGQNDALAELHFIDRSATPKFLKVAAGTAAAALTLADNCHTPPQNASSALLNGKLYWAYDSTVNRLHVYDPVTSSSAVRRVGLALPAAPTVANTGSGTYAATIRYYRIRWMSLNGSDVRLLSNGGTSQVATPSGSGAAIRVTRPAAAGEAETHWRVEGSADDALWFLLSDPIVLATTTYDDAVDPDDYPDGDAAPDEGAYTPWPSVKFLLSTGDRLLGYGAWETAIGDAMPPRNGRLYISPVLDTTETNDDERVSNTLTMKGFLDISRDAGSEDRGLCGPLDGQYFVFQSRGITMLVPTTNNEVPFRRVVLSSDFGALSHWSTFIGEDEAGRGCLYFLDPERGPYRYGYGGFQWLGYDIQDLWATVNLSAANKTAHGVYDRDTRTCKWWIATGTSDDTDRMLVFYVREGQQTAAHGVRYGWVTWTGDLAVARCSLMFAKTFGATMSRRLKPYAGPAADLLQVETDGATNDSGTNYQAYIRSKAWTLDPLVVNKTLLMAFLQAKTTFGITIFQTLLRNYGDEPSREASALVTAFGSETRTLKRLEAAACVDLFTVQVELGDVAAISNSWTIDKWVGLIETSTDLRGNLL